MLPGAPGCGAPGCGTVRGGGVPGCGTVRGGAPGCGTVRGGAPGCGTVRGGTVCGGAPGCGTVRGGGAGLLRWLGLRLWSRRGTLLFALLWFGSWLFLNGLVLVHRTIMSDFCTDDQSRKILQRLCLDFRRGSLSGDLCDDLCVGGLVEYQRCLHYASGKKVLEVLWRGNRVVLKSRLENFSSYEPLGLLDYQESGESLSALDLVFYATLEVRNSLGLAAEAGGGNLSSLNLQLGDRSYSRADLGSLWALLQQEEYSFLRLLQDLSPHVAQVLGSCGHFYAVEFLSAGHAWNQNLFSLDEASAAGPPGSGGSRLKVHQVALSFLDLVTHFDNDFSHRLHLCDVKPENFGIRTDLTVVAIDVDMVFFEPKMRDILEQNCSSDDDCSFFDCWSRCEPDRRRCSPTRRNSNMQVICEKIFRPWFSPTLLGAKAGLPLQVELQRAVQDCSETDGGAEDEAGAIRVHQRLLAVLRALMQEDVAPEDRKWTKDETDHVHTALNF